MEIKVRDLGVVEEKSVAEVEQELLEKHDAEINGETPDEPVAKTVSEPTQEEPTGLDEEQVLSFLKDRYGKEINTVGELFEERESAPELPEDVDAYFRFKKRRVVGSKTLLNSTRTMTK